MADNQKQQNAKTGCSHQKDQGKSGIMMEVAIITGARQAGRRPVERAFWMVFTSLVSLVTREDVLK